MLSVAALPSPHHSWQMTHFRKLIIRLSNNTMLSPRTRNVVQSEINAALMLAGPHLEHSVSHESIKELGELVTPGTNVKSEFNCIVYAMTNCLQRKEKGSDAMRISRLYLGGPYGRRTAIGCYRKSMVYVFLQQSRFGMDGPVTPNGPYKVAETLLRRLVMPGCEVTVHCWVPGQDFVRVEVDAHEFLVTFVPCLGRNWSEQKQFGMAQLKKSYDAGGLTRTSPLKYVLVESALRQFREIGAETFSLLKFTQYWAFCHRLPLSLEALDALTIRVVRKAEHDGAQGGNENYKTIDCVDCFRHVLEYLETPANMYNLMLEDSPFDWPWAPDDAYLVLDLENPYLNLSDEITPAQWTHIQQTASTCIQQLDGNDSLMALLTPKRRSRSCDRMLVPAALLTAMAALPLIVHFAGGHNIKLARRFLAARPALTLSPVHELRHKLATLVPEGFADVLNSMKSRAVSLDVATQFQYWFATLRHTVLPTLRLSATSALNALRGAAKYLMDQGRQFLEKQELQEECAKILTLLKRVVLEAGDKISRAGQKALRVAFEAVRSRLDSYA